jgi:hypothetical protein
VLEQPPSTPRVSQAVNYVLELCSEASAMRMSVMLIWPLLIAGVFALPNIRPKVSSLFDAFKSDYCEDLATAVSASSVLRVRIWDPRLTISAGPVGGAMEVYRRREGQAALAEPHDKAWTVCFTHLGRETVCLSCMQLQGCGFALRISHEFHLSQSPADSTPHCLHSRSRPKSVR